MPNRDKRGPSGTGRNIKNRRQNIADGRGRMGGAAAAGPTGFCICPKCGEKLEHDRALPCTSLNCPKCGTNMIRG